MKFGDIPQACIDAGRPLTEIEADYFHQLSSWNRVKFKIKADKHKIDYWFDPDQTTESNVRRLINNYLSPLQIVDDDLLGKPETRSGTDFFDNGIVFNLKSLDTLKDRNIFLYDGHKYLLVKIEQRAKESSRIFCHSLD